MGKATYFGLILIICLTSVLADEEKKPEIDQDFMQFQTILRTYPAYFIHRRTDQKQFVQKLMTEDYEKQYSLLEMLFGNVFNMMHAERDFVTNVNHIENELPKTPEDFQKVVLVLENTCLVAEAVLHIPTISYKILKGHKNWRELIEFGGEIVNKYSFILDDATKKLLQTFDYELNPEKRPDDYENPYVEKEEPKEEEDKSSKQKEKKKQKKGPALRGGEL